MMTETGFCVFSINYGTESGIELSFLNVSYKAGRVKLFHDATY